MRGFAPHLTGKPISDFGLLPIFGDLDFGFRVDLRFASSPGLNFFFIKNAPWTASVQGPRLC